MVDLEVLKAFGLDADGLKKKFQGKREDRTDEVNKLIDRMVNRCRGGRDLNLEKANVYYALDTAWDAAFNQITPTMLKTLSDQSADSASVMEVLKSAGMDPNQVIREEKDPKTPGKSFKRVETAAFFDITVPLCMAYVKIRQSKLVNDRKQIPFFKYEPVISDMPNKIRCTLITEAIEEQSRQYGYFDLFKQAVFQALHYAECLQFPVEEWHSESQWVEADAPFEQEEGTKEKTIGEMKMKKAIVKEGLRYHTPHPARSYRDQGHPAYTLNTGTGASYAGYWRVVRWHEVVNISGYYNLDVIGYDGFYGWYSGRRGHSYWTTVLQGCALNFPGAETSDKSTPRNDNEKSLARWYSMDMSDKPIVIHEHYECLIPSQVGLGDYDCPVWIRFVLAADDTVIYAAPCGYDPAVLWWGYDFVHGRTHSASMTLEVLPFQDQFSNLLAQHLLSVRQNLANLTLIDTEMVPEETIKQVENLGQRWWVKLNILRMNFTEALRRKAGSTMAGDPMRNAVISHKFPVQNTTELLNAMKVILDTLERVLVMSAQEVGQSASHEQTREEVRQISANTSVRVQFTNTGIDSTIDAWKRQLYNAKMSHGRLSFYAQVPLEQPVSKEELEKLGFTAKGPYDERNRRQYIQSNGTALLYERFASDRDGQNRVNEMEAGRVMLDLFERAMANPMIGPAIGPDQGIKFLNHIARQLGFPRDLKFENTGQTQSMQEQVGQSIQELKQYLDQSIQSLGEDVKGALQNVLTVNQEQDKQIADIVKRIQTMAGGEPLRLPAPSDLDSMGPATPEELASAGVVSL